MKMKTFKADSMQDALLQIKEELGPDAVILKNKKGHKYFMGKKKDVYEVTAALDDSMFARPEPSSNSRESLSGVEASPTSKARDNQSYGNKEFGEYSRKGTVKAVSSPKKESQTQDVYTLSKKEWEKLVGTLEHSDQNMDSFREEFRMMMREMQEVRYQVGHLDLDTVSEEFQWLYEELVEGDFEEDLIRELLRKVGQVIPPHKRMEKEHVFKILTKILSNRLVVAEETTFKPGRPKVLLFVGATGVGKTTTAAKIAGLYKYDKKKKVGIVAADSYRLGATEQMKAFCLAAEIPMETVFSSEDVESAVERLSDRDVILVDTGGQSHFQGEDWMELGTLMNTLKPDEVHLVLSCTTRTKDLLHTYRMYKKLGMTHMIFTKLDESTTLSGMYALGCESDVPISYVCNGQDIPDHILTPAKGELGKMILKVQDEVPVS